MNDEVVEEAPEGLSIEETYGTFFTPMIGKLPYESYVPHVNHGEEAIQEYVKDLGKKSR